MGENEIKYDEWYFLLTGGVVIDNPHSNPASQWLSDKLWGEICRCSSLPAFNGLLEDFPNQLSGFKEIYDTNDAHKAPLPGKWNDALNTFQKLMILRCLRPDKVVLGVQNFVSEKMGEKFVIPPAFNLKSCYDDSNAISPLIFVLSTGSDPMAFLLKFAEDMNKEVNSISLGQGQGPRAEAIMDKAKEEGSWAVLQNCHLAESWMPRLERICEETLPDDVHPEYRLWCTTYPSDAFPVVVLQNGVKMTLEPPKGMRNNMLGSYKNDPISDLDFFNSVKREEDWRAMLFGLCFFHALVQERKTFGALGWNIQYGFNESDLRISVKQLALFLDLYPTVNYKALNYCIGQCNYGGRVTDDKDRRCLMTILKNFFNEDVKVGYALCPCKSFVIPADGGIPNYIEYIESLPLVAEPSVFGMHQNANITKDQNETTKLFSSILLTQASSSGGGAAGKSKEELITEVASGILEKMPPLYDMEVAELKYPTLWEQSMNTVVTQELERFNKLNHLIVNQLAAVRKAVAGTIVMSNALETLGNSLFFGIIPEAFKHLSYPSLKPLASYMANLYERLEVFQDWLDGEAPSVYWISGFFFTQGFLTGILQNFARQYTIAIDSVCYDFEVMPKDKDGYPKGPSDGVFVHGLFIDGARWDRDEMALADAEPKVLFSKAPVIWLQPSEDTKLKSFAHYNCPVYKTSDRQGMLSTTGHSTNFVMYIRLPSEREQSFWIQRGIAMLTSLDD
jgi:dynein heavy chain